MKKERGVVFAIVTDNTNKLQVDVLSGTADMKQLQTQSHHNILMYQIICTTEVNRIYTLTVLLIFLKKSHSNVLIWYVKS